MFFSVTLFFIGCNEKNNNPNPGNDMNNMVVPDGFVFETTHDVAMTIVMPDFVDFSNLRSRFDVYSDNPENGGMLLTSGSFDTEGKFSGTLRLPIILKEITVVTIAGTIIVEIPETSLKEDGVIINFGDNYGNFPPDSIDPDTKMGQITNYDNSSFKNTRSVNLIGNGDFETNDFGSILNWSTPHPVDSRWYFTTFRGSMNQYNDGGNEVVSTPISGSGNNYVGGATQMINASAGDVITLTADIKSIGNSKYTHSWLYIIPVNSSGNALAYYNLFYTKPSDTWNTKTLVATMPTGTVQVNVLLWANDYRSNTAVFFDNVVVTGPVTDSDGDGVDDEIDDYPNDDSRAFDVYYPNSTDWGTLTYEDLWPGKGDYDFNDLVLDYRFKSVLNSSNGLVEFYTDYSVRAIGATLMNGFAFMLPGDPTNVASVTGTNITEGYLSLNANGTEQGQANTVIFLFDNAFTMIGSSGASFVNTKPGAPYVVPEINQLHVLFNTPVTNAGSAPYNPFIVVDGERGKEVHLPGEPPTDLANQALFGTFGDDSNPATDKYYQTTNNLPWALDLPVKFDYSVEQVQIINSYTHFQEWGESGGSLYKDWYENKTGYRNSSNIYSPPE
mgnify:FL=1